MSYTPRDVRAMIMMLQCQCSYEQALGLMSGVPHQMVAQMRTVGAPNYGNFWVTNTTSSRGTLLAEEPVLYDVNATQPPKSEPKPEETCYKPRSTNPVGDSSCHLSCMRRNRSLIDDAADSSPRLRASCRQSDFAIGACVAYSALLGT